MNENHTSDLPEDEDDGINLLDILQILAENARLLVFGPLVVGLIALGVSFSSKPYYVAETNIMTPQQQSGAAAALAQLGALAGMAGAVGGLKSPADMYIGLLKSRTVADRMINRFGMMKIEGVKTREDARDILTKITGGTARKDGQITIKVAANDPGLAAAMANAYVEELASLTGRLAVTEAQKRRQFLEKELAKAKQNLVKAEIALGGVGVSENTLKFNPVAMGQGLATLKAQITARELQLSSMRGVLTENSPDFRQAQRELAALRGQLGKFENTVPTGGNAEYINRYRDFKYNEVLFEQLAKQFEMAKIDESSDGAVIQVVDVAVPPERKSNTPKSKIAILATLAAGFVLMLFVFVRHALKNTSQSPENTAKLSAIRAGFLRVLMPWRRHAKAGR
ncbi:MAG: lipopolysaccharide biosynthesis protein [Gammaproteobacteria bacterium]|nr:lipopolysaccharide biosynthesis protein [Gammaproteobacteria bacterium]MBU1406950.1 lipopolysaccharide biosynthesis protein [Gammaproteobacteria bacterium]MBU1533093.1 lipopolysaccharide biosynthesis protein [Gammaproteobacteria bacterium]